MGIVLTLAFVEKDDGPENLVPTSGALTEVRSTTENVAYLSDISMLTAAVTADTVRHRGSDADWSQPQLTAITVAPIRIPRIYDEIIGPPTRMTTIPNIHADFKNEPRDESWASAMESGIRHHIANSGTGDWAVVEYIECRSNTCEIAGYSMGGTENHPGNLLAGDFGAGWWQGHFNVYSTRHTYEGEEIPRFILIVTRVDHESRLRN